MRDPSGQNETILETVGLSKKYGGVYAVKNVNMRIMRGDIYGFVGENGAGKTTVIRLITGLAAPTEGKFYLFGEENDHALKSRRIAGIVETVSLNKSMTALENLRYQCLICGANKKDDELMKILETVGLDPMAAVKRKVRHFSLGMRQRLGIASVIVQDPEFVLLDEPMNGLDPHGIIEMRETILRLNAQGITFLISSHILSELDRVCNRIGFISKGELLEEVSVEEIHSQSGTRIIAEFPGPEEASKAAGVFSGYPIGAFCALEENTVLIAGDQDINEVMEILVKEHIKVSLLTVKEITLEDYYLNKVR